MVQPGHDPRPRARAPDHASSTVRPPEERETRLPRGSKAMSRWQGTHGWDETLPFPPSHTIREAIPIAVVPTPAVTDAVKSVSDPIARQHPQDA
jgi:hypothetical protein